MGNLRLQLRRQTFRRASSSSGYNQWVVDEGGFLLAPEETGIIVCDMWDHHWSRGASERVAAMAPHMNTVLKIARVQGMQIIHAPSGTMDFYADTPARKRCAIAQRIAPPKPLEFLDAPLPVDASDGGSDTGESPWYKAWTRQIAAIEIDQEKDGISDNGEEIYSFIRPMGIQNLLMMGVHTNMCILNRSFGIKQMARWGMNVMLVRDLTDAMYNPEMPPYVSHEEGTRLVIEYIEKFWCPTLSSADLL